MEYGRGFWVRLALLALLDAVSVYAAIVLASDGAWLFLAALAVGAVFFNWVYLWPGTRALRWVTPGLILMIAFLVVPILYTFFISFTNWSTGNILNKQQVIDIIESRAFVDRDAPGELYDLYVFRDGDEIRLLLVSGAGDLIFGEPRLRSEEPLEGATQDPNDLGATDEDGDGIPDQIGSFRRLSRAELFALANQIDFEELIVDLPDGIVEVVGGDDGQAGVA